MSFLPWPNRTDWIIIYDRAPFTEQNLLKANWIQNCSAHLETKQDSIFDSFMNKTEICACAMHGRKKVQISSKQAFTNHIFMSRLEENSLRLIENTNTEYIYYKTSKTRNLISRMQRGFESLLYENLTKSEHGVGF